MENLFNFLYIGNNPSNYSKLSYYLNSERCPRIIYRVYFEVNYFIKFKI